MRVILGWISWPGQPISPAQHGGETKSSSFPFGDQPQRIPTPVTFPRRRCHRPHPTPHPSNALSNHSIAAPAMIRRRPSSPAPATPLEDDDLLEEILLRLPPHPSSLPRASAVCARWRRLLSDRRFLRRFGKHHRKPPLLGCFSGVGCRNTVFNPTLPAPDRIPAARFPAPLPPSSHEHWDLVGCRHGLAVILNPQRKEVILWHPLTGHQRRVPYPPWFTGNRTSHMHHASVLCAAAAAGEEDGHMPGECHLHPFKLAFVSCKVLEPTELCACLYMSESAAWGDMITTPTTSSIYNGMPAVMAGNALCWLLRGGNILEFDLKSERLGVIERPTDAHVDGGETFWTWQLIRTEDGGLGLAVLSKPQLTIQLWERKRNCAAGVVGWEPQRTIRLNKLFPSTVLGDVLQKFPRMKLACITEVVMVGYDEDANVIVLATYIGDFTLRLDQLRLTRFTRRYCRDFKTFYPYSSFYTTGRGVDGGAEI
uniref:Uncharacterized protein n=1 Tax=Avena sativa TaxID=4498 RepID=A0ACD5XSZ2_AVESA